MIDKIINCESKKIIVTHGTDTIIDTAKGIQVELRNSNLDKIVILTGSFLPESMKESDADFNLGLAFGALQANLTLGNCFIAICGKIFHADHIKRTQNGRFITM